MAFLIADVGCRCVNLRDTNGKSPITILPIKMARSLLMHPERRAGFDELQGFSDRQRRWQREQEMRVIVHPSDGERLHAVLPNAPKPGASGTPLVRAMPPMYGQSRGRRFLGIEGRRFLVEKTQW
jgi:hypothetical protein